MNLLKRILRFEFNENAMKVIATSITLPLIKKTIYMSNIWLTAQCWLN